MSAEEKELLENLAIVGAQANNFAPNTICDRDDYMQTGTIALLNAIRKRDPTKGKLTTYSWSIIYRDIKRKQSEKFKRKPTEYKEGFSCPKTSLWEVVPDNLTIQENQIIELKLSNYNIRQIAKKMDIKCKEVEEIFQSACQKIREANLDYV
jgi:DNA-directed RNA polymerase sigma subunit (sigma70/sigma32)